MSSFFIFCALILFSSTPAVFSSDCSIFGQFCSFIWTGGPDDGKCSACWDGFTLNVTQECWPNNCASCAISIGQCTLCNANYYAWNGKCYNPCPTTTFISGFICAACPSHCDTCTDANTCTVCSAGFRLHLSLCYNPCPTTTYPDSTTTCSSICEGKELHIILIDCPSNCDICSDSSTCTACSSGNYLYNGICYNPCPVKTYQSSTSACSNCPSNCDTCSDSSTCTACISGFKLYQGQCFHPCPTKTFTSGVTCQDCSSHCETCSDASTCSACSSGYYLYQSACYNPCPTTTYISGLICTACGSHCDACISSSFCMACSSGFYLYNGVCYNPCPTTTYQSSSSACSNCPGNCDSCSDGATCTACSSSYRLYLGQCYNPCPITTYPASSTACQNCPSNCDTCSDSSTCTACSSNYRLYQSQCYNPCPVTTFAYGSICKDCPNNCDICSDENTCTTCSSTYYLYQNQCYSPCPVTTYTLGTNCLDCSSYCDTCVDSNVCTVCTFGYYFYQFKCYIKCPSQAPYVSPTVTPYLCFKTCPTATPYNYKDLCLVQCPAEAPYLIDNVCQTESLVGKIVKLGDTAASAASTILIARSVASFSNPSLFMFGSLMKLLEYTRYMNISHSDNLEILFQTISDSGDLVPRPSMSDEMQNALESHPMPDVFEKYDFPSNFMLNEGDDILALLTILSLFVLFWTMHKGVAYLRNVKAARSLVTNARFFFQNYVIGKFYEMLGDVTLAAIFEFKTFSSSDRYSDLSLTACISCLILGVTLYGMNFWILCARRKRKGKALKEFCERYKGAEILFDGFKDESFLQQAAMLFFVTRYILSSLIIGLGYSMPLFQSALLLILSFFMVVYYLLLRPMKSRLEFVEQVSFEILLLAINGCFFIQAMCDMMQASTKAIVNSIGQTVIVLNTAFKFLPLIFLAVQFCSVIWEYYKLLKNILKSEEAEKNKGTSKLSSSILGPFRLTQASSDSSLFGLNLNLNANESMIISQSPRSRFDFMRNQRAKKWSLADDGDLKKKISLEPKSPAKKIFSPKKNINPSIILMKQLADMKISANKIIDDAVIKKKEGHKPRVLRALQIKKRVQKSNVFEDL